MSPHFTGHILKITKIILVSVFVSSYVTSECPQHHPPSSSRRWRGGWPGGWRGQGASSALRWHPWPARQSRPGWSGAQRQPWKWITITNNNITASLPSSPAHHAGVVAGVGVGGARDVKARLGSGHLEVRPHTATQAVKYNEIQCEIKYNDTTS